MSITAVTEGKLNGNGVFDQLMRAAKAHLDEEYAKNRFSGVDYSNLYLGTMNAVLQQSIQYALTEAQSQAQAELLISQRDKTLEEIALVGQQRQNLALESANITKQGAKLDQDVLAVKAQVTKIEADKAMVDQQKSNLALEAANIPLVGLATEAQTKLTGAQQLKVEQDAALGKQQELNLVTEGLNLSKTGEMLVAQKAKVEADTTAVEAQAELTAQQKANLAAEVLNIPKQGALLDKQALKSQADTDAVREQIKQIAANITHLAKQNAQIDNNILQGTEQINKMKAEIAVLNQRKLNEEAQIKDTVDGTSVSGVIGKQKALYEAQKNGFARDAEQKLAKLMVDVWTAQRATDEGFTVTGTGLTNTDIGTVIAKAKQGIGVS